MISSKSVPNGIKPQECERSPWWNKTPILYIPEKDAIQDTSSGHTVKIMLSNKVELRMTVFSQGSLEQFLSHVQTTLETIRQKGLLAAYEQARKEDKEAEKKLVKATEAYSNYQGMDENPPEKNALETATDAKTRTNKAIVPVIGQVFMLYSNLLMEEVGQPSTKIVEE